VRESGEHSGIDGNQHHETARDDPNQTAATAPAAENARSTYGIRQDAATETIADATDAQGSHSTVPIGQISQAQSGASMTQRFRFGPGPLSFGNFPTGRLL
jgi:hypothetical protein